MNSAIYFPQFQSSYSRYYWRTGAACFIHPRPFWQETKFDQLCKWSKSHFVPCSVQMWTSSLCLCLAKTNNSVIKNMHHHPITLHFSNSERAEIQTWRCSWSTMRKETPSLNFCPQEHVTCSVNAGRRACVSLLDRSCLMYSAWILAEEAILLSALFSHTFVHQLLLAKLPCFNQSECGKGWIQSGPLCWDNLLFSLTAIITRHVKVFGLWLNLITIPENKGIKTTHASRDVSLKWRIIFLKF